MLAMQDHWFSIFEPGLIGRLEACLPTFFQSARWFGRKTRTIASARIVDRVPFEGEGILVMVTFVEVSYGEGASDVYVVPITAAFEDRARQLEEVHPEAAIMPLAVTGTDGPQQALLIDALWDERAAVALLNAMRTERTVHGLVGRLQASATDVMENYTVDPNRDRPAVMTGEQSNTSVRFGRRAMLKLYRRPEQGLNPDLELGRALTNQGYRHTPSVLGALEYLRPSEPSMTIGIAHQYIENRGDAWSFTLEQLERRWDQARTSSGRESRSTAADDDGLGPEGGHVQLLGRRTAELHRSLSECRDDPALTPEPAEPDYWKFLEERVRNQCEASLDLLRQRRATLPPEDKDSAERILLQQNNLLEKLHAIQYGFEQAIKIRCHGDFHLGQVLFTGDDFIIIDFEGEPARPLAERRAKQVPLLDVAGMIRSLHYASAVAARRHRKDCGDDREQIFCDAWTARWYEAARSAFLRGYAEAARGALFWLESEQQRGALLDLFLLDKAFYELSYELNNRPDWAGIPLRGILESIGAPAPAQSDMTPRT
jgi:trehalose synthase-fused probable maltokinase